MKSSLHWLNLSKPSRDRIMSPGKTNVTSNTVLAGHVDNFKSQMAEVLVIINILVICFIIRW